VLSSLDELSATELRRLCTHRARPLGRLCLPTSRLLHAAGTRQQQHTNQGGVGESEKQKARDVEDVEVGKAGRAGEGGREQHQHSVHVVVYRVKLDNSV